MMGNVVRAYPCGTEVTPHHTHSKAIIVGVLIRESFVTYEIAYFNAGDRKTAWVSEIEFSTAGIKSRIGFK
jgi:hypothetical protein